MRLLTLLIASPSALLLSATLLGSASSAAGAASRRSTGVIKSGSIKTSSSSGQNILSRATRTDTGTSRPTGSDGRGRTLEGQQDYDFDYVSSYSIKFQGCHHISQWNGDANDEDDVRVYTKRLVRFRLCPTDSCDDADTSGCTSKYGDYVIDLNSFVEAYLEGIEEDREYQCQVYERICEDDCDGQDDDACEEACMTGYGMSYCYQDNGDGGGFDVMEYAQCAQYDFDGNNNNNNGNDDNEDGRRRRKLDGEAEFFIGPYCADQGGEIHLGLFTDDTCTTFSEYGDDGFYSMAGFELPYSDSSIISTRCLSCSESDVENDNNDENDNGDGDNDDDDEVREVCEQIYAMSGKCETKMSIDYPNESACTYIEGIKIVRDDGVIRTSTTKKSKAAAVCIGLFTTVAVLLGAYVYYLRTKLGRAKINLSSSGAALT